MTYDALIPVIRRLALEAGDKIMEFYEADDFDVKVNIHLDKLLEFHREARRGAREDEVGAGGRDGILQPVGGLAP